jgi:hypothetical protein
MRNDMPMIVTKEEDARLYAALHANRVSNAQGDAIAGHPEGYLNKTASWWKKSVARLKLIFS